MNIEKLTFFMHAGYSISDTKEWRGLNSKAKPKIFCPFYCVNIFFPTWTYPFCQVIPSLYSWKSKEDYLSTFRMKMFVLLLVGNYFSTERMSIYARVVNKSVCNIMMKHSPFSWPGVRRLCKKDDVVLGLNECCKSFAQRRLSHLKNR